MVDNILTADQIVNLVTGMDDNGGPKASVLITMGKMLEDGALKTEKEYSAVGPIIEMYNLDDLIRVDLLFPEHEYAKIYQIHELIRQFRMEQEQMDENASEFPVFLMYIIPGTLACGVHLANPVLADLISVSPDKTPDRIQFIYPSDQVDFFNLTSEDQDLPSPEEGAEEERDNG